MPAGVTVIEIGGNLGKHKLKLTYLFAVESVRMRIVEKFLNHLLPQSCWFIMVLFQIRSFSLENKVFSYIFGSPMGFISK